MQNLLPYIDEQFHEEFSKTSLYNILKSEYDVVSFGWSSLNEIKKNDATPRQEVGQVNKTIFSAVPFYYINFLLSKRPKTIYDLGCGWNIFKKYIPNIIGVGAEDPNSEYFYADQHDYVDYDFVKGHQNYFESVFSINALHFQPLKEFPTIVADFFSMIKPGGRGFLALNIKRMLERDDNFKNCSAIELENFCRRSLSLLSNINFLVVDIRSDPLDEYMDGNIRLVMEK